MAPPTTELTSSTASTGTSASRPADFFGRREAFSVLDGARHVVVVGPPGVGKTRLACEYVAQRRRHLSTNQSSTNQSSTDQSSTDQLPRNEWLHVDLRDAADVDACWRRLATALGAHDQPSCGSTKASVLDTLTSAPCEGVLLDAAEVLHRDRSMLSALQEAAPSLKIIATSRRRFALPHIEHLRLEGLEVEEAVALYRHLARRDADDALAVIAELVTRLDALPWPVRLAAGRAEVMSAQMMLDRLDRQFDIFGAPGADRDETFEQAIRRSWDALKAKERLCLCVCSVFTAPFTLEAAESVATHLAQQDPGIEPVRTVELLSRLLDASWLKNLSTPVGQTRFAYWQSLRVFARQRLEASGRAATAERGYVAYYCGLGRRLSDQVETPSGIQALELLRQDAPHLLEAFDLCLHADSTATQTALQEATELLWALRWNMRLTDAAEAIRPRLEHLAGRLDASTAPGWLARIDMLRGELALRAGHVEEASDLLERAFARAASSGDRELQTRVARASSMALAHLDLDAAEQRIREALDWAAKEAAPIVEAGLRERLGFIQLQTFRLEEARQSFRRARRLLSANGNALLAAQASIGLAYVALRTGHRKAAASAFEETVQIYATMRDRRREAEARFNLGVALHADAKVEAACEEIERALDLWDESNETRYGAIAHARLGLAYAELGASRKACASLEEAIALGQRNGDWHNRAIAEAALVMLDLLEEGLTARIGDLEQAVEEMHFAGDPDAAAAGLCVLALLHAARRQPQPAAESLRRIMVVRSLVAQQDIHLLRVIDGLLALGRQWTEELLAKHGYALEARDLGETSREELVRYVPSLLDDEASALAQAGQLFNPYLRLLFAGYIRQQAPASATTSFLTSARPEQASHLLTIHNEAHWFKLDDHPPVDLLSRQPLRRLLRAIIISHLEDASPGCSVDLLIKKGWPDAVLTHSAGSNRVYTGIRSLRDMGLESVLITGDDGYRFAEEVAVKLSGAAIDAAL